MSQETGQNGQPLRRSDFALDPEAEESFDFRRYAAVVWHRKWLIMVCVVAALLLGAVQLKTSQPVYSTKAKIRYDPVGLQFVNFAEVEGRSRLDDEIRTQIEVIRSPRIIRRVIDALGLYRSSGTTVEVADTPMNRIRGSLSSAMGAMRRNLVSFEPEVLDPELARKQREVEILRSNISVQQVGITRLIEITVYDSSAERAAAIANELCNQYILSLLEDKTQTYRVAAGWFETQLAQARERLEQAEQRLYEYQGNSDIRVLQQNYEIATESMRSLSREIEETQNEIARLEAENVAAGREDLQIALLTASGLYGTLLERLNTMRLERAATTAENTESHPRVRRLTREIAALEGQVKEAAGELLREAKAREEIARLKLASLRARLNEQESHVQQLQKELISYRTLQREVESNNEIFTALLDQSKQVDVTGDIDPSNVTVIEAAATPEFPSSPNVMRTLLLFALLGFSFGTGLVLLVHKMDRSIKDPQLVEARLGLPTLGTVPYLRPAGGRFFGRRKGSRSGTMISEFNPKSVEAEAFRVLRTAVQYSTPGHPPKVLLISSCHPQEGKSTVALNLALSYAQRGDKVLLIDADLKMPVVHKAFGKVQMPGLSDVLTGQEPFDRAVVPSGQENLDIVPAGYATPSPADLLESQAMADLLTNLRSRYQAIIIDSAPLGGMADTLVLTRMVDGLCIVVNRGRTPIDSLTKVVATLDNLQVHILGVVYNARQSRAAEGYGTESYGYGIKHGYAAPSRGE